MSIKKKVKEEKEYLPKLYFAVRIRGRPGMNRKILHTLQMLRMHKVNHGVLIWGLKSYIGMLNKVKDFIAFGEIDETTLLRLLRARGKIEGNRPLTEEHIKNLTKYKSPIYSDFFSFPERRNITAVTKFFISSPLKSIKDLNVLPIFSIPASFKIS